MPLRPGMATSIRTSCGSSWREMSTAWRPLAASPTTDTLADPSSKARIPERTSVWSSAKTTRIDISSDSGAPSADQRTVWYVTLRVHRLFHGNWRFENGSGALPRLRIKLELAAQGSHPFVDAGQAQSPAGIGSQLGRRVESTPVIIHHYSQTSVDPV